ncbi:MAG: hypothetical protein NTX59_11095 [Elusimicrobia bacterium]|nr:hypothetical protein [Elusimicrobiota bacterium]
MNCIAIILLLGGINCIAGEMPKNWEFKSGDVLSIQAETASGEIKLVVSEAPTVKVELIGEYSPDKCEITSELNGGTLFLKAKNNEKKKHFWNSGCKAGFSVTASAEKQLEIKTGAGAVYVSSFSVGAAITAGAGTIKLDGLSGAIRITSGAGRILGDIYSEKFDCKSGAGDVAVNWLRPPKYGSAAITTGAGRVSLGFPKDSRLNISHKSGFGSFNSDFASDSSAPFILNIKTGAGSVKVKRK